MQRIRRRGVVHSNVLDKIVAPGWELSWTRRRHHGLIRVVSDAASFVSSEWRYDLEPGEILRFEQEDTYRVATEPHKMIELGHQPRETANTVAAVVPEAARRDGVNVGVLPSLTILPKARAGVSH